MNKRKLIGNTLLALGLLAAGASFAAETESTAPATRTPEQREAGRAEMKEKMANMTPEQREKEQALRDKMMEKMMGAEGHHAGGMSGMKGGEHGKGGGAGKEGAAEHQH